MFTTECLCERERPSPGALTRTAICQSRECLAIRWSAMLCVLVLAASVCLSFVAHTRVLSGETSGNIRVMAGPPVIAGVDWRQLRRWNMPKAALPLAVVLYRPPTPLAHYTSSSVRGSY